VLLNLLSNAIKYNVPGGFVLVHVQDPVEGRVAITVRDTGPGLTAEQRSRLFQPFDRLGAARSGVEGHGLGLLICRELLTAMDGHIAVDEASGPGCSFTIRLPLSSAMPVCTSEPAGPGMAASAALDSL
jgi:signal transduction histidine kinase